MAYFKTIDGCSIHYEIVENILPTTTVFLHGNLSSNRWWYPARDIWASKASHNYAGHMILLEFRGAGKSDCPKSSREVNMDLFAEDFISLIYSLDLNKVNLVGHSTGGLIAAIMLGKNQNLFAEAFLLNSVGVEGYSINPKISSKFLNMKTNKKLTANIIGSVILNNDFASDFFNNVIVEDAFISAKNDVCANVFEALKTINITKLLGTVYNQIYVGHGEFDNLLTIDSSIKLAESFPNGKFIKILNQGHCANIENPVKFVDLVDQCLFPVFPNTI